MHISLPCVCFASASRDSAHHICILGQEYEQEQEDMGREMQSKEKIESVLQWDDCG